MKEVRRGEKEEVEKIEESWEDGWGGRKREEGNEKVEEIEEGWEEGVKGWGGGEGGRGEEEEGKVMKRLER